MSKSARASLDMKPWIFEVEVFNQGVKMRPTCQLFQKPTTILPSANNTRLVRTALMCTFTVCKETNIQEKKNFFEVSKIV